MAYDEMAYRRPSGETGEDPMAYPYRTDDYTTDYRGRRRGYEGDDLVTPAYVETSAEPLQRTTEDDGRDRLGIHIGWEIVLLLAVAAIGYLLYRLDPASLRRPALDTLLVSSTVIGLLTMGAGLTLRAGVPNLAVGPIALAAALHYAENGDRGLVAAAWPALTIAAVGGLIVALVVTSLHVPGWAATLVAAFGVIVVIQLRTAPVVVQGDYEPADQAYFLFLGFAVLALVGGGLGALRPVRRWLGRMRPAGDPATRRGPGAVLPVVLSLVLSSVFAVAAGFLMAAQSTAPIAPSTGMEWTGLALGTAMLAGTSAYGRRGGIFGTLLAVAGVAMFLDYADRREFDIALYAIAACVFAGGLVITRLVETYGRPLPVAGTDEVWNAAASTGTTRWSPELPENWSPGVSTSARSEGWDDGPWGTGR
ncbi:ABC transporter permease [Mangrovihabitans endophyticus]|uniref:Monosaccharide ABC transporter membrane protein, CUT2 family n=1 Tax=Mangrovihabitans endophyticus TaxID=1751298 RepID=A0A8J3C367_9ACTN|nr:ABC transporter permease [Mangrovihabitans endophyticus]GGL03244.1 hypothetical protein GCM10012284_42330 [Mangrovihabitans endophyticus]